MFYYLLLLIAILLEVGKNVVSDRFSKKLLNNETDLYQFNFWLYLGSFAVLLVIPDYRCSWFTVLTGVLFALSIWVNQYFYLKALKTGAFSFVTFIQGMGLLVPIVYGVFFWDEVIRWHQIVLLMLLIVGMGLSLDLKRGESKGNKWILFSFGAMLGLGAIGVLQGTHQMSDHKSEIISFIRVAFLVAALIQLAGWRVCEKRESATFKPNKKLLLLSVCTGAALGVVHILNLFMAGVILKIIFFPVANGGLIFVSLVVSRVFLKETCTKKQWLGIILGTIALSLIGL
ncbi:MAG: hypothetical protein E7399_10125 [Ruminococcaceae bacterium]|nr:hypothetical protein [Oscillospiraceae bacterium]